MEGENDLGSRDCDRDRCKRLIFQKSFYGEFAIANAVSDLLLDSLGLIAAVDNNELPAGLDHSR